MGKLVSVSVAALQYALSYYIFKKPDVSGCGPWLSSLIVLVALTLILWDLQLYPSKLRKLLPVCDTITQYLVALFLIEYIMGSFWFPLETTLLALMPKYADHLEEALHMADISCQLPCELLRKEGTGICVSYMSSVTILLTALHATRMINLKLLVQSPTLFFEELTCKVAKVCKKVKKCLPKVGGRVSLGRFRSQRSRKQGYCSSDDGFEFEPDCDTVPTTDTEYNYGYH